MIGSESKRLGRRWKARREGREKKEKGRVCKEWNV